MLLRCLFNLPFRHRWSWKLCPLLKLCDSSCCNNTTKNQVFLGRFCSDITRLRSATRARALSPSLRARASPVTDVGSQHAHTLARKNERRARSYRGRRMSTCPEIQLSELPLGPKMKRLSRVLGRWFLFWSASALCTEKFEGFFLFF